jgi:Tfp pilus assembly protein PilN
MPLINLIQEQRYSLKKGEAKARTLFMGFVGVSGLSVLMFGLLFFETDAAAKEAIGMQAKAKKVEPIVKRIEADELAYSRLSPRVQILEDAQAMTSKWVGILDHLATQTPQNTWLTGLRCVESDPTKPITISFSGLSDKQELVGELIMRLQNSADLENVALRYTQEKVVAQGTGIEFEIAADVAGSIEQKEKPKEDKGGS